MPNLILKRMPGEVVMIGDNIKITVLPHNKIAIEAPRDVPVHRLEVYEAKKKEKESRL